MRRLGKCDGCRRQKVKCDEQKPSCSNCQRGRRPCHYSHGQGFAMVMQDPTQMTKYGKSLVTPIIQPLGSGRARNNSCALGSDSIPSSAPALTTSPPPSQLHLAGGTVAENGQGVFQILTSTTVRNTAKEVSAPQRRAYQAHLRRLQQKISVLPHQPSSPETNLTALFINMLQTYPREHQPLFTLGDWISSVPSRIGSCQMVTLAAEFFVCSFEVFRNRSHSNKILALQMKAKALKELQLGVLAVQQSPTYDMLIATKLHYAAEILLGVESMHYAVHTLGLMDLLKSGLFSGADEEHLWNVIDNTYIDDITIAMTAGRTSVYDNHFYMSSTHPATLSNIPLTTMQSTARAMMHILIQCPRLVLLIRHAISDRRDVVTLASAISLAENLWQLAQADQYADFVSSSTSAAYEPVDNAIIDILSHGLRFNSIQSLVFCTRYWLLQVILSGMIDTLYRHFPQQYSLSFLPEPDTLYRIDTGAAINLGQVLLGLDASSSPLILVRLQGPLAASIGSWHRVIRYLSSSQLSSPPAASKASKVIKNIVRAERMKQWLLFRCNQIQTRLSISAVDESAWLEALDCMAGEEMLDWIPTKVSFDSEDGEMVMKLEYDGLAGTPSDRSASNEDTRVFRIRNPSQFGLQHLREWIKENNASSN